MRNRSLGALLVLLSIGLSASAQNQSDDTLQALKNSMSPDQQSSILQGILGKTGGSTKTDAKLKTPETVQPTTEQQRELLNEKNEKTRDGRILRQSNEDPELRADDTVVIDLTPLEDVCSRYGFGAASQNGNNPGNGANGNTPPAPSASALSTLNALNGGGAVPGAGAGALSGINGIGSNSTNGNNPNYIYDLTRCPSPAEVLRTEAENTDTEKVKTEKAESEKLRKRILSNNPYNLNHFGVLELPGLPAIPLAGLTAFEATKRLGADPDLADYFVKLTLMRLLPTGQEALKPFGYDLFEGVPSTFAPVSDIQVPVDYIVGPGDTLEIQPLRQ